MKAAARNAVTETSNGDPKDKPSTIQEDDDTVSGTIQVGRRDLIYSVPDVLASTANFLHGYG